MEQESRKPESNELSESMSSVSDSTSSKETIEERYNKLRGFAVKLKKKVSDLTEQVKQLELEKEKLNAIKEEVQNKLIQISNSAKKLRTIQLEYDKLQDEMEQRKFENQKLMKNIETLVGENTSLKESLYKEKDNVSQLLAELAKSSKDNNKFESAIKQSQEQNKKLSEEIKAETVMREQMSKEYETLKNNLEYEIQSHKTTRSQLDSIRQEHTSSSVLSLEVKNYEKSIDDMKSKLKDEESKRATLEKTNSKQSESITLLNKQVTDLRSNFLSKSNQLSSLGERNETIKAKLNETKLGFERAQHEVGTLTIQLKETEEIKSDLLAKIKSLESDNDNSAQEFQRQNKILENQLRDMRIEILHLTTALKNSRKETEALQEEFNVYKRRAQSVLRTKQSQNKEIGMGRKSIIELEEEIVQLHQQNAFLQKKLDVYGQKVESLTKELMIQKDEKDHALESLKESNRRQSVSRHEISSLTEQREAQEVEIQKLNVDHESKLENLEKTHMTTLTAIKEIHKKEINDLKLEIEKLKLNEFTETVQSTVSPEKNSDSNLESNNHSSLLGMSLLEREECEGSENVDSCPLRVSNAERYHDYTLITLDELLNSSDDYNPSEAHNLPLKVGREELEVYERRVKHLTVLLADAERDIAKLTQLNKILKEDIRKQQRSFEREQHANNFEYLKNVVFKFVTLKNGDERSHLIPVLTTILKLSPEETQKLNSVSGGKSWIPGIPIPGWHYN